MQNTQPTFLGIGAHKAGTTWLHYQLSQHQQVWLPPLKELHFFDRSTRYPSPNYLSTTSPIQRILGTQSWERSRTRHLLDRCIACARRRQFQESIWWSKLILGYYSESWYCSLFPPASATQRTGEITPAYSILDREDVARIKRINPEMQLIFLIRNPIDRAWSAIRYDRERDYVNYSLDTTPEIMEALQRPGLKLRGDYERTIDTYLEYFDSSQILVCFYDAIQRDPINLMSKITDFLGVDSFNQGDIDHKKRVNTSTKSPMPQEVCNFLYETYSPNIERLAMRFGSYAIDWQTQLGGEHHATNGQPEVERVPAFHP